MASPESRSGGPNNEQEAQPQYAQVARYADEVEAGEAYFQAEEAIFETDYELSAYRLQLEQIWRVAVFGDTPPEDFHETIQVILAIGEPTAFLPGILAFLNQHRLQARKLGPWVKGHYRPEKRFGP
jgi:hypothetical protein